MGEQGRIAERRIDDLLDQQAQNSERLYKLLSQQLDITRNLLDAVRENTDSFTRFLEQIKANTGKLETILAKLNGIRSQDGSRISIPGWLFYAVILALLAAVGVDVARLIAVAKP